MNKWKIYFLFFGFALCFGLFGILNKNALAVESYKISPEDDRYIISRFYENSGITESRKIDMHYYFYAENPYGENLKGIAYICDYKENRYGEEVKTINPCGLEMVQEAGKFKIKIRAGSYFKFDYSRKTQKINRDYLYVNDSYNYGSYQLESFTDEAFEKGLTLLGGSTLLKNEWNRNEGGFLIDPVGGSNQNQNNNGHNNGSGFNLDILGGIKGFFQPMIDSITRMQKVISVIVDNIINGIANLFNGLIEAVKNIWNFLYNLPAKIPEMIKAVFVPADNDLNQELGNLRSMFSFEQITRVLNTTYLPLDSVGFRYDSNCVANYWDATSPHLSKLYNSGSNKYWDGYARGISICNVPKIYITLARNLLLFAFFWWAVYRILQIIPVVMGSAYVWDRWTRKEG